MVIIPSAIIKTRHQAVLIARFDESFDDVGFVAARADVIIGLLARPQAMPRDMFGGQDRIFHPRIPRDLAPLIDVQLSGE